MERNPRIKRDKKESRTIRTVSNDHNDLSGGNHRMFFQICQFKWNLLFAIRIEKGNGIFYPTLIENARQKLYTRFKDAETPERDRLEIKLFSVCVRTESSFRMVCLKFDCLADNRCDMKRPAL